VAVSYPLPNVKPFAQLFYAGLILTYLAVVTLFCVTFDQVLRRCRSLHSILKLTFPFTEIIRERYSDQNICTYTCRCFHIFYSLILININEILKSYCYCELITPILNVSIAFVNTIYFIQHYHTNEIYGTFIIIHHSFYFLTQCRLYTYI
jgi:hypothetical protein